MFVVVFSAFDNVRWYLPVLRCDAYIYVYSGFEIYAFIVHVCMLYVLQTV